MIVYSDYLSGDDDLGTGEPTNPYKTISRATYVLDVEVGNEVRVGKGPANTILPGTLTWANGNDEVLTSEDLTTYLGAKDFVKKNSSEKKPWEILSVSATKIVLVNQYQGTSEAIQSVKIGVIDTGSAGVGESIQQVNQSGYSYPPDELQKGLKISGGWDLSQNPPVQNGETWFRQSGTNRQGIGLNQNGKNWIYLSKLNFLRYDQGLYNPTSTLISYWLMEDIIGINQSAGLSLRYMERSSLWNSIGEGMGASGAGIHIDECSGLCGLYDSLVYGYYGININKSANSLVKGCDYLGVGYPVKLKAASFNRIAECDFGDGLILLERGCIENRFYDCDLSEDFAQVTYTDLQKVPAALFKSCNSITGSERAYYNCRGYLEKDVYNKDGFDDLTTWTKKVRLPINATADGAQTDYVLKLNVHRGTGSNSAGTIYLNNQSLAWPYDIRFVNNSNEALDFFRGEWDETQALYYIEVDSIPAEGSVDIWCYYGRRDDRDVSDLSEVGQWNEDFRGQTELSSKWTLTGSPPYHLGMNNPDIDLAHEVEISNDPTKYEAWPAVCRDSNGRIYVAYRVGDQNKHVEDLTGRTVLRYSDDGGQNWSSESVISDTADKDDRNPGLGIFQDETGEEYLICVYNTLASSQFEALVRTAPIDTLVWSDPYSFGTQQGTFGQPIQLSSGRLLLTTYWWSSAPPTNWWFYSYWSDDFGATWNSWSDTGSSASLVVTETVIFECKTEGEFRGRVYAITRNEGTGHAFYATFSDDYGETWCHDWFEVDEIPHENFGTPAGTMIRLEDDRILMPISYLSLMWAYVSKDECKTWEKAGLLYWATSGLTAKHYMHFVRRLDKSLGMAWCTNYNDPGGSDVIWQSYIDPMDWDSDCLEIKQLSTADNYIQSVASFGPGVCLEGRIKFIDGAASGSQLVATGFGLYHGATYDCDCVRLERRSSTDYCLFTVKNGVGRSIQSSGYSRDDDWHIIELKWDDSLAQFYQDQSKIDGDISTNIPTASVPIVIGSTQTSVYTFAHLEWLLVRKFANPEPTWGTPGSEEAGPAEDLKGACAAIVPIISNTNGNVIWSTYIPAESGTPLDITLWGRRSKEFDGSVSYDLLTNDGISLFEEDEYLNTFQELSDFDSETWAKKTIHLSGENITKSGALELLIKVAGTKGKVFIDKIGFEVQPYG